MEAKFGQTLQFATWIDADKLGRKPGSLLQFYARPRRAHERLQVLSSGLLRHNRTCFSRKNVSSKEASHLCRNSPGSLWQTESFPASLDEANIMKNKSEEIEPYLEGRCIYLVGMMGSGKTTIGKILSESLDYQFRDCDTSIEQSVGVHVKEIFKLHGESFFRDNETEVLRKYSSMQKLVVSTGGGAVVRPINWKYMHTGISVWLDVPLEALARRVAADGTQSRPLLSQESGDDYSVAFTRLTTLLEERGKSYANANTRVRLEHIAAKLGYLDVFDLTPAVIAIEVLEQIEMFLKR